MFPGSEFFGDPGAVAQSPSFKERSAAAEGFCPTSRVCSDLGDLAGWFKSFAIAAGVIAKSAK
jgi:hypothetical protein